MRQLGRKNTVATCIVTSATDSGTFISHSPTEVVKEVTYTNWIPVESTSEQIGCIMKTSQSDKMPVKKGLIGNAEVSVLRDSGCNAVIVKRDLV